MIDAPPAAEIETVLLAAFIAFIRRYSGETDISVRVEGAGIATTVHIETAGDPAFSELLARVELEIGGARAHLPYTFASRDLTLCVAAGNGALAVNWTFDAAVSDRETVERMAAHFGNLLASVAREPQLPLSRLALTDAAERARAIALGRGPLNPY